MRTIDEIHAALSRIDDAMAQIERFSAWHKEKSIDVEELDRLCVAVNYVLEWDSTAYSEMPILLGISAPILQKFLKFKGKVRFQDAKRVAERLKTYVRSLDQVTTQKSDQNPDPQVHSPQILNFEGKTWVAVERIGSIQQKIALISSALSSIVTQMRASNLPPEQQILSQIERQQLIVVLETALVLLKSPMVEKGLLDRAKDDLQKTAKEAAEKQVQAGVGELATYAAALIRDLIKSIFI